MELAYEIEENDNIDYKYIYCVLEDRMKRYFLYEADTRYIHDKGGSVSVVRCREGDLVYVKAKINSGEGFNW